MSNINGPGGAPMLFVVSNSSFCPNSTIIHSDCSSFTTVMLVTLIFHRSIDKFGQHHFDSFGGFKY